MKNNKCLINDKENCQPCKYVKLFAKGFLAGLLIAIAAFTYLILWGYSNARGETSLLNHFIQGLCFCVGIVLIVSLDAALFTGRIGYLYDRKPSYLLELLIIFVSNALGAILFTIIFYNSLFPSKLGPNGIVYGNLIKTMINNKLNINSEGIARTFLGAVGTGVLIHAGFAGYKYAKSKLLGTLALLFSIWTFLLLGFDHCLASFSFFAFGSSYHYGKVTIFILVVTIGNSVGSIVLQTILKIIDKKKFTS